MCSCLRDVSCVCLCVCTCMCVEARDGNTLAWLLAAGRNISMAGKWKTDEAVSECNICGRAEGCWQLIPVACKIALFRFSFSTILTTD